MVNSTGAQNNCLRGGSYYQASVTQMHLPLTEPIHLHQDEHVRTVGRSRKSKCWSERLVQTPLRKVGMRIQTSCFIMSMPRAGRRVCVTREQNNPHHRGNHLCEQTRRALLKHCQLFPSSPHIHLLSISQRCLSSNSEH